MSGSSWPRLSPPAPRRCALLLPCCRGFRAQKPRVQSMLLLYGRVVPSRRASSTSTEAARDEEDTGNLSDPHFRVRKDFGLVGVRSTDPPLYTSQHERLPALLAPLSRGLSLAEDSITPGNPRSRVPGRRFVDPNPNHTARGFLHGIISCLWPPCAKSDSKMAEGQCRAFARVYQRAQCVEVTA